jgi:putative ABC transport system permease protein
MLTSIAWKNVWRNKVRSIVLIGSITLGICAGTFILAFSLGMSTQYVNIAIKEQISHIQIHNPAFKKEKKVSNTITDYKTILQRIEKIPGVKSAASRSIVNGMVSSPTNGAGATILGIDPSNENAVTGMHGNIKVGEYLDSTKINTIIIGEKLAHKLKVKIKNKVVLTFVNMQGNLTAGAFHITGIFKTRNSSYDEMTVFINSSDLNRLLGLPSDACHEIAVLLNDNSKLDLVQQEIKKENPQLTVENWKEIAPELSLVIDSFGQTMYLFIVIILLALTFGIINTMLMAVLERVRELGMLMAIGMNKPRVFFMIMFETLYLSLIGGPLGVLIAYLLIHYFSKSGIDLSSFAQGLSAYGMDSVVYPILQPMQYLVILMMVVGANILAAIYPSLIAIRLKPVNAIRKL